MYCCGYSVHTFHLKFIIPGRYSPLVETVFAFHSLYSQMTLPLTASQKRSILLAVTIIVSLSVLRIRLQGSDLHRVRAMLSLRIWTRNRYSE